MSLLSEPSTRNRVHPPHNGGPHARIGHHVSDLGLRGRAGDLSRDLGIARRDRAADAAQGHPNPVGDIRPNRAVDAGANFPTDDYTPAVASVTAR